MSGYFPAVQCPEIAAYGNLHTCTHKIIWSWLFSPGNADAQYLHSPGAEQFFNGKTLF